MSGALAGLGVLGLAGGIGSAIIGSNAAQGAAKAEEAAAGRATQAEQGMFGQAQNYLSPYATFGTNAMGAFNAALPSLTAQWQPTMQQLQQTPGYQFALNQGLQATQNSYAAQGLGDSGAALKGAAQYSEGLASTTYQQQFENYLQQNQQRYNMLYQPIQTGQGAAGELGGLAVQTGGQIGGNIMGAGNAAAGGIVGSANAITGALGGITNNAMQGYFMSQNPMYNGVYNSMMMGGGQGTPAPASQGNAGGTIVDPTLTPAMAGSGLAVGG